VIQLQGGPLSRGSPFYLTGAVMQIIKSVQHLQSLIHVIRDKKVMLDEDLARLYEVPIKRLNEQVRRNPRRFPEDFIIRLSKEEFSSLRSQNATLENGRGRYRKFLPYAFTEQGVAMLSSVLNSDRAIEVNVEIMRAFSRLRDMMFSHSDLARKLQELEIKCNSNFKMVFDALTDLTEEKDNRRNRKIGFSTEGSAHKISDSSRQKRLQRTKLPQESRATTKKTPSSVQLPR
jgi:hypothetical protein